jgi:multimeric flavodoxin WrbA
MNIRACTGCEKCRGKGICKGLKDDMGGLYEILEKAQGLLLVSPTHHYNVSVSMKAFIDRLYPFYDFSDQRPGPWSSRLANRGKKAALATVCEQISTYDMGFVMEAMERPLLALGYEVIGKLPAMGIFEAGGVLERKDIMRAAHEMGNDLVKSIPA